jgi:uncharacterized membrane protein YcaP (DUF421 family)
MVAERTVPSSAARVNLALRPWTYARPADATAGLEPQPANGGGVAELLAASLVEDLFVPQVSVLEKVLRALLVFVFLVMALRLGGKRELGQINVLDLAVLLLASNALQNAMIGADNSLVGGVVGAATLFVANYVFVRVVFRSRRASRILEGRPSVLLEHGRLQDRALRAEAITENELRSAALERGFADLSDVDLILLEPNGHLAIMGQAAAGAWRERHAE